MSQLNSYSTMTDALLYEDDASRTPVWCVTVVERGRLKVGNTTYSLSGVNQVSLSVTTKCIQPIKRT